MGNRSSEIRNPDLDSAWNSKSLGTAALNQSMSDDDEASVGPETPERLPLTPHSKPIAFRTSSASVAASGSSCWDFSPHPTKPTYLPPAHCSSLIPPLLDPPFWTDPDLLRQLLVGYSAAQECAEQQQQREAVWRAEFDFSAAAIC